MKKLSIWIATILLLGTGCKNMNKAQKGVLIGAAAGGAVGAGVGKVAGNTAVGAIIGATVGGVAGGLIGRNMDKQAAEISKIPGAKVERVGEGINVTFDSGVLFDIDKTTITGQAQQKLNDLTDILNKYPDTYILVEGHTDASGSEDHNLDLSERRAKSVAGYLRQKNVRDSRIKTAWYGENQPKFPNSNEEYMAQNRRVEFAIYANEKMVEEAKKEANSK
jgi:outer membrane protein OmpA-like peptidoglycan-associated protein